MYRRRNSKRYERRQIDSARKLPKQVTGRFEANIHNVDDDLDWTFIAKLIYGVITIFVEPSIKQRRQAEAASYGFEPDVLEDTVGLMSDDFYESRSFTHWLRSAVQARAPIADSDATSAVEYVDEFVERYRMVPKQALELALSVPEPVLLSRSPLHWVMGWILQRENPPSAELLELLGTVEADKRSRISASTSWPCVLSPRRDLRGEEAPGALEALLEGSDVALEDLKFHTTSWGSAENIANRGINVRTARGAQDFTGRGGAFYVNHTWEAAVEFADECFPNNAAILVYNSRIVEAKCDRLLQIDWPKDAKRWEKMVRMSRLEDRKCEADDCAIMIGPQAKRVKCLRADETPERSEYEQTAYKTVRVTEELDDRLIGVIFTE